MSTSTRLALALAAILLCAALTAAGIVRAAASSPAERAARAYLAAHPEVIK